MSSLFLKKAIKAATIQMVALYDDSKEIKHAGEKGMFREYFVSSLLEPFLPAHFGIGSGIIVDAQDKQSQQSDIIIYDKRLLPPIFKTGFLKGVYPIDSVMCVLEVKSRLKARDYSQILDAARKFSSEELRIMTPGTLKDNHTLYPLYGVFAFESTFSKDEMERAEKKDSNAANLIRVLCVLNKGVWSHQKKPFFGEDAVENAIEFVFLFLDQLEATAKSRGHFRLSGWLK